MTETHRPVRGAPQWRIATPGNVGISGNGGIRGRLDICGIGRALSLVCAVTACGDHDDAPVDQEVNAPTATDERDATAPPSTADRDAGGDTPAAPTAPTPHEAPAASTEASSNVDASIGPPAVDAGNPDASSMIANADAGIVRASTDPLWVYIATPEGSLRNVTDPAREITGVTTSVEAGGSSATPWSKDGHWLALVSDSGTDLHIIDLQSGELDAVIELPGTLRVLDWAANSAVLVHLVEAGTATGQSESYAFVDLEGSLVPIYQAQDDAIAGFSLSPDGRSMLLTTNSGSDFMLHYVDTSDPTAPSAPRLLATYAGAPVLSQRWSPDSRWVAFGTPSEEQGVKLWSPQSDSPPWSANPPGGTGFSPLYSFSPASTSFVSHLSGDTSAALILTPLGDVAGEPEFLERSEGVSPAAWSPLGDYVTYSTAEAGFLHPIAADGRAGTRIPLPGWNYACPLAWASPTSFIYETCSEEVSKVRFANLEPSLVSTPIEGITTNSVRTSGECIVTWDDLNVHVGKVSDTPTLSSASIPITPVELVFPHPEGKGVAWTVRRSLWYWLPFDDCVPAAEPVLLSAASAITQLEFVPTDYLSAE